MIRVIIELDGQTEVSEPYPGPFLLAGPATARSVGEWLQLLIAQAQVSAATVDPIKGPSGPPVAAELVGRSVGVCPSCGVERWLGYGPCGSCGAFLSERDGRLYLTPGYEIVNLPIGPDTATSAPG